MTYIVNYPESVSIIKRKIMNTQKTEVAFDIFEAFALSNEEMINIRGGEGDPITKPQAPPIII